MAIDNRKGGARTSFDASPLLHLYDTCMNDAQISTFESPQVGERFYPSLETRISEHKNGEGRKVFTLVVSPGTVDRHMTRVVATGIDTRAYLSNKVVLFNHDPNRIIGRTLGLEVKGGLLMAKMEFDEADPFAAEVKRKVEEGFINAASLGFIVREMEQRDGFMEITESEMVEFSIVSIPSAREALVLERDASVLKALREDLQRISQEIASLKQDARSTEAATEPALEETINSDASLTPDDAEAATQERTIHDAQEAATEPPASSLEAGASITVEPPFIQRKATESDYAALIKAMVPEIRKAVRRSLGKE